MPLERRKWTTLQTNLYTCFIVKFYRKTLKPPFLNRCFSANMLKEELVLVYCHALTLNIFIVTSWVRNESERSFCERTLLRFFFFFTESLKWIKNSHHCLFRIYRPPSSVSKGRDCSLKQCWCICWSTVGGDSCELSLHETTVK